MKTLRNVIAAVALSLTFSMTVLAGDIWGSLVLPTPPVTHVVQASTGSSSTPSVTTGQSSVVVAEPLIETAIVFLNILTTLF